MTDSQLSIMGDAVRCAASEADRALWSATVDETPPECEGLAEAGYLSAPLRSARTARRPRDQRR